MNIKNYLKIFLIITVISICISTVYSDDFTDLSNVKGNQFKYSNDSSHMNLIDGKLSLENVTFNVPEGFEEDKKSTELDLKSDEDSLAGLRGSRCTFIKDDDFVTYMVIYSDLEGSQFSEMTPLEGYDSDYKTISGKDGILTIKNGTYLFAYGNDNGFVQIESNKEDLISQSII